MKFNQKKILQQLKSKKIILPGILILIFFISLVMALNQLKQQQLAEKRAYELAQKIQIGNIDSDWVPINLEEFASQTDAQVNKLNQELQVNQPTLLQTELSLKNRHLAIDLQVLNLMKREYALMDENQDGQIDYQEFLKRDGLLAHQIYELKHTALSGKPNGIFEPEFNYGEYAESSPVFKVFVEAGIIEPLRQELIQYAGDVAHDWGYQIKIYACNNCTKEEIKNNLKQDNTVGALLVGDLPIAWYQVYAFNKLYSFPIDLYFTDLDGNWESNETCFTDSGAYAEYDCFSNITGNFRPDIFLGRLATPNKTEQIAMLQNYFRKNHNYRTGTQNIPDSAVIFGDFPEEEAQRNAQDLQALFTQIQVTSNPLATAANFREFSIHNSNNFLHLVAHSKPDAHYLSADQSLVSSVDIKNLKPQYNFYDFSACSVGRYTTQNYIVGWYIFQESDYGLVARAASKDSSNGDLNIFYQTLKQTNHFGEAVKNFLNNNRYNNALVADYITHIGDKLIIGDPTLKIKLNAMSEPTPTNPFSGVSPTTGPTVSPIATPRPSIRPSVTPRPTPLLTSTPYPTSALSPTPPSGTLLTPLTVSGPKNSQIITASSFPLELRIKDISTDNNYPHDIVFTIWEKTSSGTYNKLANYSSGWIPWAINKKYDQYVYMFARPLPVGNYQWRVNLRPTFSPEFTLDARSLLTNDFVVR